MMNSLFKDYIDQKWLDVYIDDMLILGASRKEVQERTKKVLQRLKENDLYLKLEKCKFCVEEVEFLGMVLSEGKIRMDSAKLAGIAKWPAPQTVKQVRSFLGFANFYRKFIGHFAGITKPLTELTKKGIDFKWTEECQHAFEDLKRRFMEKPVLVHPDVTKPFIMETDASLFAVGAVLKQRGDDGEWHPCAFYSHRLSPTEQKWQTYDRELLAIEKSLKTWNHLLKGSPHDILIFCDHANLRYYKQPQLCTARQQRMWANVFDTPHFVIEQIKGTANIQADALSRRSDYIDEGIELMKQRKAELMLHPDRVLEWPTLDQINRKIADATKIDTFAEKVRKSLELGLTPIKSSLEDWSIDD
jgi:hypothetical protein